MTSQGRQEDAEEFLGCVLVKLHEEMTAAKRAVGGGERKSNGDGAKAIDGAGRGSGRKEVESFGNDVVENEEGGEGKGEDEWEQVGPKNKSTITRQVSQAAPIIAFVRCIFMREIF